MSERIWVQGRPYSKGDGSYSLWHIFHSMHRDLRYRSWWEPPAEGQRFGTMRSDNHWQTFALSQDGFRLWNPRGWLNRPRRDVCGSCSQFLENLKAEDIGVEALPIE